MSVKVPRLRFLGQDLDKKFLAGDFGILKIKLVFEAHASNSHPCPAKSLWLGGTERKARALPFNEEVCKLTVSGPL